MRERSSDKETSPERSPWSRPSVLLSGAFLLALALLGILVAATGGGSSGGQPARTPTNASRPAAPPANATATATASGCPEGPAGSQTVPSTSPPQAQWGTVGSMQVPQNPNVYGPERTNGPWETCFAHNPVGALLAALNFWSEGTAAPSGEVYRLLAVDVPAAADRTSSRLDSGGPVQWAGYKYDSYTPSQADVSVVLRGPQGKLVAFVTPLVWTNGDWRYLFPPNGEPSLQTIPDLSGYVAWSDF